MCEHGGLAWFGNKGEVGFAGTAKVLSNTISSYTMAVIAEALRLFVGLPPNHCFSSSFCDSVGNGDANLLSPRSLLSAMPAMPFDPFWGPNSAAIFWKFVR